MYTLLTKRNRVLQVDTLSGVTTLERSHAELRAALLFAAKEIRKLNFGRADSLVLAVLRRVLREAREVARKEGSRRGFGCDYRRIDPMRLTLKAISAELARPGHAARLVNGARVVESLPRRFADCPCLFGRP